MVVLMRVTPWRRALLAFTIAAVCLTAGPAQSQSRRVIRVTAERFSFTPSQIVLAPGEEVEIRLKSDDTAHGFRVAGAGVNLVIPKRGYKEIVTTLKIDAAGRYEFECTRMCGAGHNFMRGVIIVRAPGSHQ